MLKLSVGICGVVGSVGVGGNIATRHLSLGSIALSTAVEVAGGGGVSYIAIAVGRVPVPGRNGVRDMAGVSGMAGVRDMGGVRDMAGVGIRGTGSSNVRIGVVVTVSISAGIVRGVAVRGVAVRGVAVRGVAVRGIAVRGIAVRGIGSISRGAISVGRGDHSLTGSSAHVHLLAFSHAPLVFISRASMTVSVGGVIIAISIRGVPIAVGRVTVTVPVRTVTIAATIASITISAIAAIPTIAISVVTVPSVTPVTIVGTFNNSKEKTGCQ